MAYTAKDPRHPHSIFCTKEKQKVRGVKEKTHATARGMGKNVNLKTHFPLRRDHG